MYNLLFIDWNPARELFSAGPFAVRWYALCWVLALGSGYFFIRWMYRREQIDPAPDKRGKLQPTDKFDPLVILGFFGILIGARLGHCLFYEPDYFLGSKRGFIEMLLPIQYDQFPSQWHFTGYAGLASHGGTLGLIIGILIYLRKTKLPAMQVLDIFGVTAAMPAAFIRLGNLMNSEIIGRVTDVPWAFIFHTQEAMQNGQLVPRHPSQLYEALVYVVIFAILFGVYRKYGRVGSGFYFGACLTLIFTARFFIEFLKEVQGGTDDGTTLFDMGQMLSVPFVLLGIICMVRAFRKGCSSDSNSQN